MTDDMMENIKEDILKRTYEIQSYCHSAEITGIQTVIALADQDEQLRNIQSSLMNVDDTLIDTKQNINQLKGLTQRMIDSVRTKMHRNMFSKVLSHVTKRSNSSSSSPRSRHSSVTSSVQQTVPRSKSFTDEPIDDSFDEIGNTLHRLKNLALDMNDQLTGQAVILNDIHKHITKSTSCIKQQNIELNKMVMK